MTFRKTLSLAALAAALPFAASAADLPVMAHKAPAAAYLPSSDPFTGFSIGGLAGYGWNTGDMPVFVNNALFTDLSSRPQGFALGLYANIGQRFGNGLFYIGAETDGYITKFDGTAQMPGLITTDSKNGWLGTTRGRLGFFLLPNIMAYGTAGVAYGNPNADMTITGIGSASNSSTKTGWTAGAGVEAALSDHWLVRIQYLRVDLGKTDVTDTVGRTVVTFSPTFQADMITAGVGYKF